MQKERKKRENRWDKEETDNKTDLNTTMSILLLNINIKYKHPKH